MDSRLLRLLCTFLLCASAVAGNQPSAPTRDASGYRLRYREPHGCDPDNCDYFVGIDTNTGSASFLDFYLVGRARGWVAVGFSTTHDMPSADVLGCSVHSGNTTVLVIDTYNPAHNNTLDDSESSSGGDLSDVVQHSKELVDGKIRCVFSRRINGADPSPQDFDLDQSYYLQFGTGDTGRDSAAIEGFSFHEDNPRLSKRQYNPARARGDIDGTGNNPPWMPIRNASDYRLRYREPKNCEPDNCTYFVGIDTNEGNSSFLDFYFVGRVTGWVALGISKTANMLKSDVFGCSIDANGTWVLAVDTYNPASHRTNELDDSESDTNGDPSDVIQYWREYEDGRIKCVFSRLIEGVDPCPQDLLLNQSYYLQFGTGERGRDIANVTRFHRHERNPPISQRQYNLAVDRGDIGSDTLKRDLITAHAVLMLVAWPLLAFTGIFFATWMRPALPNGQWFQAHRAFNLASLLVAVVGFALVFIAYKDESPPGLIDLGADNVTGTVHFALGIVIMALQVLNPLISFCRCKPDDKHRWIFNVIHGVVVGYGLATLATVNAGVGVSIFSQVKSDFADLTLLWIYLAFAVFSVVLGCVLFFVFTGEALIFKIDAQTVAPSIVKMLRKCFSNYNELQSGHDRVEMEYSTSFSANRPPSSNNALLPPDPDQRAPRDPSRDAPLRWVALAVFLLVTIATVVSLSVLMIVRGS